MVDEARPGPGEVENKGASISYIGDPFNPPLKAIISVAAQLQAFLIASGALAEDDPLPFPELDQRSG